MFRRRLHWVSAQLPTLVAVSEPAHDLPVSSPAVEQAVELASHGVITHLTIHGERVAAVVPESVLEALRAAEDALDIAEAEAAMNEPGASISLEELEAEAAAQVQAEAQAESEAQAEAEPEIEL